MASQAVAPAAVNETSAAEERAFVASQWQLVWRKFRRHKLAVAAIVVLGALYFMSIFAEFFTPYPALHRFKEFGEAPPTRIRVVSPTRGLSRPFVFATARELDMATFTYQYTDSDQELVIRFFVRSEGAVHPARFHSLERQAVRDRGSVGAVVHLRLRPARARRVLAHLLRRAHLRCSSASAGCSWRSCSALSSAASPGTTAGSWTMRYSRVIEFLLSISQHPVVDRAVRHPAARLGYPQDLLRHHHHSGVTELDRPGAGGARQADQPARRGLRDGGPGRRRQERRHHQAPPGARLHQLPDHPPHPGDSRHDHRRDGAQLPGAGHPAAGGELGHAAAGRAVDLGARPCSRG